MLEDRRWFGSKGKGIERATLLDVATIEDGPPALIVALCRVEIHGGISHLYHLPLLIDEDGSPRDALDEPARFRVVGDLMAHGHSVKGDYGAFHYGGPGLDPMAPPGSESIRAVSAEQSNSSIVLDDAVIVKMFRRVEPGPNPDLELNRLLTNEGFEYIPPQVGEIVYEGELEGTSVSIDLGIAQQFVRDGTEGWSAVLDHVRVLCREIHPHDPVEDAHEIVEERAEEVLADLERLGEVTGALHVALAREELEQDFVPEPVTAHDLATWATGIRHAFQDALRTEIYGLDRLEERLERRASELEEQSPAAAGLKTRIHGDYHLGQVLLTPARWLIIDFEGEPLRPLDQRRRSQHPLRDVAGMLRSFSYAASAALFERTIPDSPEWAALEPWVEAWEELARDRYLGAYLAKSHEGKFLPADRNVLAVILDAFEIDKALYELAYERGHRPEWVRIPLRGIEKVLERGDHR